ncbi:MAG: PqiC family protein [Gammaproteobacteria bacterium]|nr:PqiC family protein [Gammaproteobacteria bacterium]
MIFAKNLLPVLLLILLGACGSTPPSNYYMLSANAGGMPGSSGPALGIGPIQVPEYLRRNTMVLNRDSHRLTLAEYDRWAEPLKEGIARVVALNLAVLLDTQQVQRYPWRRHSPPQFGVSVQVIQMSLEGNQASLVTEWSLTDVATSVVVVQKISSFKVSADSGADAVAAAYSDLLLQLSEEIAAATREQLATAST